jgi:hypothetical protein
VRSRYVPEEGQIDKRFFDRGNDPWNGCLRSDDFRKVGISGWALYKTCMNTRILHHRGAEARRITIV